MNSKILQSIYYLCTLKTKNLVALTKKKLSVEKNIQSLRNLGINPYPANLFPVTHTSNKSKNFEEEER
jgi:lysyl-tRNA synthetase class 2